MPGGSSAVTEQPTPRPDASSPEAIKARALDLAALLVFVVTYAAGAYLLNIESWQRQWWVDGAWTIAALATAFKCLQISRTLTRHDGLAWGLLGYACLAWFAGMIVRNYFDLVVGTASPFPSIAELGFLGFALLFLSGLFCYGSQLPTRAVTYRQICNLGIIFSTLVIGLTIIFLDPIRTSGESKFAVIMSFAYPLLYWYAFFFGLVRLWLYVWGRKRIVICLLIAGLATQAVAGTLHAYELLGRLYEIGSYSDVFWLLGFVLFYWAAIEQDRFRSTFSLDLAADHMDDRARTLEPLVPALGLVATLFVLAMFWQVLGPGILPVVLLAGVAFAAFLGVGGWLSHRTETELRERVMALANAFSASEARLARMLEMTPEPVIAVDERGHVVLFNRSAEAIFGYGAEEILGRPAANLIPECLRNVYGRQMTAFADSPEDTRKMSEDGEIAGLRKDGSEFPAEASVSKFQLNGDKIFILMLHDITERRMAVEAISAAKEQAEAASRAKSEFLANMSHELRTPLNAVIGFSEIIEAETFGPIGDRRYREYAADIHESGNHLLYIINDILDLAKVESGQQSLEDHPVEIGRVIEVCQGLISTRAAKAGLALETELPAPVTLIADQRKLKQILINLLSNAVKFTRSGGRIVTTARVDGAGKFELSVRDTGIGIAPELIDTVLAPFAQADTSLTRTNEGTGLGLPLAKALTELHGGTFSLDSEVGVGTTVTLRLPAERVLNRAAADSALV